MLDLYKAIDSLRKIDEGKNKTGPQEIAVGDRVEFEGEKFEVHDVELDTIVADNLVTGLRNRLPTDKVTRIFGADATTDQDKQDMEDMFKRLDKEGSGSLKHVATEDDTLKIGTTSDMEDKHYPITYTADISYDDRDRIEVDNIVIQDKNGEMLPPYHPVYQAEEGFIEDEVRRTGEEEGEVVGEAIEDMENIEERVTYSTLAKLSGIKNPNKIFPGQKIKLPGGGSYTVKRGDTLSGIAQDYRLRQAKKSKSTDMDVSQGSTIAKAPAPKDSDISQGSTMAKAPNPSQKDSPGNPFSPDKKIKDKMTGVMPLAPPSKNIDKNDPRNMPNRYVKNKDNDYKPKLAPKVIPKKDNDSLIGKIGRDIYNFADKYGPVSNLNRKLDDLKNSPEYKAAGERNKKLYGPKVDTAPVSKVVKNKNMIKRITGANT